MNSQELIFKITRAKWTGVVGQTVESLLCKLQALSLKTPVLFSNPYTYTHTHTHTHTHNDGSGTKRRGERAGWKLRRVQHLPGHPGRTCWWRKGQWWSCMAILEAQ
jgi:hypothetical protein